MTQDQRNSFVKLVEQCRSDYRQKVSVPYELSQHDEKEARTLLEKRAGIPVLRAKLQQARTAVENASKLFDDADREVDRQVSLARHAERLEDATKLEVFTKATAEILSVDDAKEAQAVITRLLAL